jgi:glycosyltransferase involved in cell wall biosynthesis
MQQPFMIVTGDFVKTGGMDRANYALADYISRQFNGQGTDAPQLHLVAHRIDPTLKSSPTVQWHQVKKPVNSYFLGSFLLAQQGQQVARTVAKMGGQVIVNGGNCSWGDINWVHYVHAAYEPVQNTGALRKIKGTIDRQRSLATEAKALNAARLVIANSERTRQDLIEKLGLSPTKIKVCYYGNDPQMFYPALPAERQQLRQSLGWDLTKPVVLFIGALGDRRKGFDTLFAAWEQLCQASSWNAQLKVIGRGAELPIWQQRVEAAGLGQQIEFLGFRKDVPNLMRAADCLVAPTRYEAYGLGVHEALCCGLPAIVSAGAGVAERYPTDLKHLLLQDPDNPEELAQRLLAWHQGLGQAQDSMADFAACLRNYTWDHMAAEIINVACEKA